MKKYFLVITILFLTSCGYQPLLINKSSTFKFKNALIAGDEKISKIILKNLSSFKSNVSTNEIEVSSSLSKNISANNKKGDPEIFNIKISVTLIIKLSNEVYKKSFSETISYNNLSSNFELKQYENRITINIIDKISQDIALYFRSI